jgi:uncharacterized protein
MVFRTMDTGGDTIQARVQVALRAAMKAKDTLAVSALRSVLAAIGNAEAVPPQERASPGGSQHVAGGAAGLGAAEAERRRLRRDETAGIVRDEISDRQAAARQYEAAGHPERAARLRREAQAIQDALDA